jgi:benzoate-CoA ligase
MRLSTADHSVSPPRIDVPREYNAAHDLIERNLAAGRGAKTAYIDDAGEITYAQLAERVDRFGSGLASLGVEMENRVLIAMLDTIDWPVAFLGAIKAGIVPVAVNTLLTTKNTNSCCRTAARARSVVSEALLPAFAPLLGKLPFLKHVIVSGRRRERAYRLQRGAGERKAAARAGADHSRRCVLLVVFVGLDRNAEGNGARALGHDRHRRAVRAADSRHLGEDVVFSAAKLFFAYGLGNALQFPLAVGRDRGADGGATDARCRLQAASPSESPTIFYGVPTLYAALLADPNFPQKDALALRHLHFGG